MTPYQIYQKAYREANKEKLKEYHTAYKKSPRGKLLRKRLNRKHYENRRNKLKKGISLWKQKTLRAIQRVQIETVKRMVQIENVRNRTRKIGGFTRCN